MRRTTPTAPRVTARSATLTFVRTLLTPHHWTQFCCRCPVGSGVFGVDVAALPPVPDPREVRFGASWDGFAADDPSAGIERRRFHDLRHSTATVLMGEGVPARVVMELLGHSQSSLTMNTYSQRPARNAAAGRGAHGELLARARSRVISREAAVSRRLRGCEAGGRVHRGSRPRVQIAAKKLVGPVGLEPTTRGL